MCNTAFVKLLAAGILCWAGLPAPGGQNQGGVDREAVSGSQGNVAATVLAFKAYDPQPPNGACGVVVPLLSWKAGDKAIAHDLYVGKTPDLGPANLRAAHTALTMFYMADIEPATTYYWRVDEIQADNTVIRGDLWCFTTWPAAPCTPVTPVGLVYLCCDPVLTWSSVVNAAQYHVYVHDNLNEVVNRSPPADRGMTPRTVFPPGPLQADTTYYWVVDAISPQGTVWAGTIWDFTTAPCGGGGVLREWWLNIPGTGLKDLKNDPHFPKTPNGHECVECMEGPTDWADDYGTRLSALLLPPMSGIYQFWIAGDDQAELWLSSDTNPANASCIATVNGWTAPREWTKEAGQKSGPIMLQAGRKYYIEALGKEGAGGDNLAVSWQAPNMTAPTVICTPFVESPACTPFVAHSPYPRDGDPYVVSTPILSWQAGREALRHAVYFSDDYELVAGACPCGCGVFRGERDDPWYDPGPLAAGTYYWRVDEVNAGNAASPWRGCVWSFTIPGDCEVLIDNFESYSDFNPIQFTWAGDPYPVHIEQTVVHGGLQSMRLEYDNGAGEARPATSLGTNWTVKGVSTLSLWFHGRPASSPGSPSGNDPCPLYVRIVDTAGRVAMVVHPNSDAVLLDQWTQWKIPLATYVGVSMSHVKEVAIGVGGLSSKGTGTLYIDDICLQ